MARRGRFLLPLNRLTDIEGNWACQRTHYTYDPANRLIASQHNATAHHYAFDPAGNRVDPQADDDPPLEPGRRWPDNRIAALDGVQNTYDGAGNLIEQRTREGLTHYLYDGAHRLRQRHRTDRTATKSCSPGTSTTPSRGASAKASSKTAALKNSSATAGTKQESKSHERRTKDTWQAGG